MPISALPQSTVRLLGSSVVITKPCDVVKELLDNAIDAGASCVEIAISPNHLDTIRVRDDGRGVDVEDFDALGRRAHTSKLESFEELGSRARETLGFRGEALAALNTLAVIILTTRTAKDVVATRLQLKSIVGGVEKRQPASAPVGTTVQITKLFENLPARKQYSLKNNAKHIQSTKDLLKAYALARPDLRLSLKVLGEATYCWSYAPTCAAGVKEAVLQIFGTTLANSCIHVSRNSGCDQTRFPQISQQSPEDFILEALIPKLGFDAQAVKGKGFYLSIDSRPISSNRGIAKKITAIFKTYLNRAAGTGEFCASIPNPFVQLNIRCPPCSYDANVAPLKDEVVFGNEDAITTCFEGLCRRIYPQRSIDDPLEIQRRLEHKGETEALAEDTQTLACSSNVQPFRTTEQLTAPQGTAKPSFLSPDSCTQDATSLIGMRTSKTVNMSRTNSNSTDEDSTANSVDIQVPLSFMTATHVPSSKRADGNSRIPKMSASENIERYLLSRKNDSFQIATDETATKKTQPSSVASASPPNFSGRMPLQPLTESVLNAMGGQAESESDTSSAEPEILDNNAESIIAAYRIEQRIQRTSPDPTPSLLELEPLEHSSPHQLRSATEWPTPPSSGHLRSVRPFNSPFRPPLRAPQRDSSTGGTAHVHARSRLRASDSGRVIPFTLPGQNRIQRPAALERTAQRVGSLGMPRSTIGETRPQLRPQRVHGLNRQRDNMSRDLMQVSEPVSRPDTREHVLQPNLSLHGPGQYSRIMQANLMRSLSPDVMPVSSTTAQDGLNADDSVSTAWKAGIFSQAAFVRDTPQDITPPGRMTDNMEDPRLYLIKRRRSQARHGMARRLSSRRLPLEAIPHHFMVQNASISRRTSLRKVKSLARQARLLGNDIVPGNWGHAIEFKSMEEAGKVERRLQHAVEAWKQTQNQAVEVEYKLRSAAKGKSMSC